MSNVSKHFLFDWPDAFVAGAKTVGGKGWNLGRLHRYGIRIPKGLVLATGAYEKFLEENDLHELLQESASKIDQNNISNVETERTLANIRDQIAKGIFPTTIAEELFTSLAALGILGKPLAVRSSASAEDSQEASFAGIHSSYLNITAQESIRNAIKNCYASLWTLQAVAYRRKKNIDDHDVLQAVVIMEMVEAEAAGIAFSCEPSTGRGDCILINANFGLGESVVSGQVNPDEYELTNAYLIELKKKKIGAKQQQSVREAAEGVTLKALSAAEQSSQVLSDQNILRLGSVVQRIFEGIGEGEIHQDIEWVYDGKNFVIVQARPVTSLPRYTFPQLKNQPDIWSNANIKDSMPMALSLSSYKSSRDLITDILTTPFHALNYPLLPGIKFIKVYQGRGYFNLSLLQYLYYDLLGTTPAKTNELLGGHQPVITLENQKKMTPFMIAVRRLHLLLMMMKASKDANKQIDTLRNFCVKWCSTDIKGMTNEQILFFFTQYTELCNDFTTLYAHLTNFAGAWVTVLTETLSEHFPGRELELVNALMLGQSSLADAELGYQLMQLADEVKKEEGALTFFTAQNFEPLDWEKALPDNSPFKDSFRKCLSEFGHRAVYEVDIVNPRWQEDPSYLLNIVKDFVLSPQSHVDFRANQKARNAQAWVEIKQELSLFKRLQVKWLIAQASKGSAKRELGKSEAARSIQPIRYVYLELGSKFVHQGLLNDKKDIFHLVWPEIKDILTGEWDGTGMRDIVKDRQEQFEIWEGMNPPDIIIDDAPQFAPSPSTNTLQGDLIGIGIGAASGKASGIARIIKTPHEGHRLNMGDVLVAPSTDPGWTPLFLKASAIIVESGGYLSHGAIIAREYGIPAVLNIPHIMSTLKDGTRVFVDGDGGKILRES